MYIWVLWGVRIQGFLGAKGHKDKDSSLLGSVLATPILETP